MSATKHRWLLEEPGLRSLVRIEITPGWGQTGVVADLEQRFNDLDNQTELNLLGIGANQIWFVYDYADDFKKVAAVVGKKRAPEVLKALKSAVPGDWEERADDSEPEVETW